MKALSDAHNAAFERFWAAYPRRPENPKAPARSQFAKLVAAGEDPAALVAAASAYAAFCAQARKQPEFVPHARTWLAQRRFEDFAPASQEAAPAEAALEHPLAWLAADIGADAFASWIAPLRLVEPNTIVARTHFAVNHVRKAWGAQIEARLGPVAWAVAAKEPP